jgi:hypothetical protein
MSGVSTIRRGVRHLERIGGPMLVVNPYVLDANIFYPHRGTLVYSETNLGAGALAIPAYWATRNPYFTFNFAFILSMVLGTTGGYYLVRYLVDDRRAAAVSAIAFGFCPYVFARTPEMQLLMTAGLPFSMLAFHRTADRPTTVRAVALGLAMAAQVAFCGYYAVFAMLMVGFATFTLATTRHLWTHTALEGHRAGGWRERPRRAARARSLYTAASFDRLRSHAG